MRSPSGLKEKEKILQRACKSCQSFLDLRGLNITSVPREVFSKPLVQNLKVLELSCNGLQSLPSGICHLFCLQELYLRHNDFKDLPKEFGDLPNLKKLDLVHNSFQEVPFCVSRLCTLEWLNLSGNLVEIVPLWLLLLPHLRRLYLVHNLIENIPREIYLQGIDEIRKYFRLPTTKAVDNESCNTNLMLLSPTRKSLCKVQLRSKTLDREGCDQDLLSPQADPIGEPRNSCEQIVPCSGFSSPEDSSNPGFLPVETSPGVYLEHHQCLVSGLEESHQNELHLIEEQTKKILLSQELRKLNIDYLRQIKNQQQPVKPLSFPRRRLDFSLDLENLGIRRSRRMTTSEYGTCSSFTESMGIGEHFPLGRKDSFMSFQSSLDDVNNNIHPVPRQKNFSSDSDSSCLSDISDNDCYVDDSDLESLADRRRHITLGDICVIIPEENLSGHLQSEFTLEVMEDMSFYPKLSNRQVLASEVIEMAPHGAKFYDDDPAIISLPYDVKVGRNDTVACLCSNTGMGQRTRWEKLNPADYNIFTSHVEIRAYHFSLFAIIVSKGYPEAHKTIRAGVGGCLYVPEVPGVEVLFPETSLFHDIEASVKVLYADEPYDVDHSDPEAFALATPVVQLGPHGCVFNPHSADFVTVRLPLPDGKEIQERYGDRQLTFWCSSTTEDEDLEWQQFQPKFTHIDNDNENLCSVYFSVEHFSYFRVLWNIIDAVLWEAKLGASSIIPIFQFNVSFQALMTEVSENGLRFGICVACYRFGKPLEGIGNFPILVGKCIAPKMLRTGKLQIRLESNHFKADTSIGVKELVAVENFTGRPFVIQFGCQFTGEAPYGNFGSVLVEQPSQYGGNKSVLSFLLNKPRDTDAVDGSLDWELHLTKELTNLLSIKAEQDMGDDVWHEVAEHLGYTPREITNLNSNDNPMAAVIADYKRRGGMPHQFITALYKTGSPGNMTKRPMSSGTSQMMDEDLSDMEPKMCPCVKKNARKRRLHEPVNWEEKFQDLAQKVVGNGKWKQLGRVLGVGDNKIQEIEHDCSMRQDGLQEKTYQVLITWRDLHPDRCNLNNLSSALCKVGLGYVARQYCLAVELG
ncbi:hypothetical protein OS493_017876 [Desmophyllum pertusum]|uniref:Death domain-containing protein n=1 Tax=Desmophyllum pertusum TaxID=174260 RepID=A0A9W9Z057_9CNID|nr:hypothetical protein OS493_017876 [Desmophyllum pertusum]